MKSCADGEAGADFDTHVPGWLKRLGLRFSNDIGFVVHDWTPKMEGFAGIYQQRNHLAAAAVDSVVTQLSQHEHGVPEVPRQIMVPPLWMDGPSVQPLGYQSSEIVGSTKGSKRRP